MAKVFKIPCKSEAEAKTTAKQINDVSPDNVTAEAVEESPGQWVVKVTVA